MKWVGICPVSWALDAKIGQELGLLIFIAKTIYDNGQFNLDNQQLSTMFGVSVSSIGRRIKKLSDTGYIKIEYGKKGCKVESRLIRLSESSFHEGQMGAPGDGEKPCFTKVRSDHRTKVKCEHREDVVKSYDNSEANLHDRQMGAPGHARVYNIYTSIYTSNNTIDNNISKYSIPETSDNQNATAGGGSVGKKKKKIAPKKKKKSVNSKLTKNLKWGDLDKKDLPKHDRNYYKVVDDFMRTQSKRQQVKSQIISKGIMYGIEQYKSFDKLLQLDKLTKKEAEDIIKRVLSDSFWNDKIMTIKKLRQRKNADSPQYRAIIKDKMEAEKGTHKVKKKRQAMKSTEEVKQFTRGQSEPFIPPS